MVKHHHDIPEAFYDLFLEEAKQTTCVYFQIGTEMLQAAQTATMDDIAAKLYLHRGIGRAGARHASGAGQRRAFNWGHAVVGAARGGARARAERMGLSDWVEVRLQDDRNIPDRFDCVVCVGMLVRRNIRYISIRYAIFVMSMALRWCISLAAIPRSAGCRSGFRNISFRAAIPRRFRK